MGEKMRTVWVCSICQQGYEGHGNNASPVNSGRCCDECDWRIVVPIRIRMVSQNYLKKLREEQ